MTERRRSALRRSPTQLSIGPSALDWSGDVLTVEIAERAVPRLTRIEGTVRLYPHSLTGCEVELDADGLHRWTPIAPRARIDVQMRRPHLRWCGSAYLDANCGHRPLEDDFAGWTWSRTEVGDGAAVLYDVLPRRGDPRSFALAFDESGEHVPFEPPRRAALPRTGWRIDRETRSEGAAHILDTLEDTPFYARSLVAADLFGEPRLAVHESLSLDRFRSRIVQAMLPFRMPRTLR